MSLAWKYIATVVLAALIQCSHAPKRPETSARIELSEIVNIDGQLTLKRWDLGGPSKTDIDRLQLDKCQKLIDSTLMPQADPVTREKLSSIKSIIERAQRGGEALFKEAHNIAAITKVFADLALVIAAMAPDEFQAQVHVPSTLLITADSLENLRGDVDVDGDISRYRTEALTVARRTVERFPNAGRAYGELGVVLSLAGGTKEEMRKLFKRCIELDSSAKYCRENLRTLSE